MKNLERIAGIIFASIGKTTVNKKEVFLLENGSVIDSAAETVGEWNFEKFYNKKADLNICGKTYTANIQKTQMVDIWEK